MNVETMRVRFRTIAAGLADSLSDGEIDAFLNRAYQFDIPAAIDGEISETTWDLTTSIGVDEYAYPSNVIAPRENAWITDANSSIPLWVTSNPVVFEDRWADPTGAAPARPIAVLFYGRVARFSPVPDAAYTIEIPARGGPATALTDGSVIANDTHAMCVVHAALSEFFTEIEAGELFATNSAAVERYASRLMTISRARPKSRTPARSF
jgi:hypothetical protein